MLIQKELVFVNSKGIWDPLAEEIIIRNVALSANEQV